ncbi:hypothetical protein [Botrimarina hoheduenensis]|uniref:DUF1570 domain-containing protein n=1 Tax=Botrimarina hoheduenensis TaxID=2528000 RepID=A0A5C5WFE3_9BACT|nr:hypothetical protein [Botrimarina hoheduenensis]TWT48799.1 hypothetical protein Pla111_05740 [Botrimarina hoheduenensis]
MATERSAAMIARRRFLWLAGAALAGSTHGVAQAAASAAVRAGAEGLFRVEAAKVPPEELRRVFAKANLGELQQELLRVLNVPPPGAPIRLVIGADATAHRKTVSQLRVATPYRRALYVRDRGQAVVLSYLHDELALDLRHEGTHALLHADQPALPLWLDEGIASYFQEPAPLRPAGGIHHDPLLRDLRGGRMTTLAELEQRSGLSDLTARDYRFAWAWTHYLLHGPHAATRTLWCRLEAGRRRQAIEPLALTLPREIPQPEAALRRHFLQEWPQRLEQAARFSSVRAG